MARSITRGVAIALLFAAACTPSPTASPTAVAPGAPTPSPLDSGAVPSPTAIVALPGKSETAWGRIWEDLPPSFPLPAGAEPAEIRAGTATAAFDVPAAAGDARAVAQFYADAMVAQAYSAHVDGPLEDGSFVVAVAGPGYGPCRMEIRTARLGSLTRLTVLYGASCEFF